MRELLRVVADDDDQRAGRREAGGADGSDLVPGKPLGQLVCRGRRQQVFERRRGVILAGSRQVREPRRDRRVWARGSDIDPVDRLVAELVDGEQPPQWVRGRGARRRRGCRRGVQPSAALGLALKPVDAGERHEEQADPERNRRGRDKGAQRRFAPAAESEAQSEANHRSGAIERADDPVPDDDLAIGVGGHPRFMGDEDNGRALLTRRVGQKIHDELTGERVERPCRFVGEEHFGLCDEAAGQCHALGLPP